VAKKAAKIGVISDNGHQASQLLAAAKFQSAPSADNPRYNIA